MDMEDDFGRSWRQDGPAEGPSAAVPERERQPDPQPVRPPSRFERYVGQMLSGSFLMRAEVRRQYPYVLFMALLMFLYIANGFHIQKLHRRHDRLTVSSLRMISTRQSEIIRELELRGIPLEESLSPPKVIEK